MKFSPTVRFVPWVGSSYHLGFRGATTLILGESHYQKDGKAYSRNLNIELISGQADKKGKYLGKYPFWTKIIQLLSHEDTDPNRFWHSVAYYNFIQDFVGLNPRDRPNSVMWHDAQAPFFEVITKLRPDFILVLGNHLWSHLPCAHCYDIHDESPGDYCRYSLNAKSSIATKINHPSSFGFRYSVWRPHVEYGFQLALKFKNAEQSDAPNGYP